MDIRYYQGLNARHKIRYKRLQGLSYGYYYILKDMLQNGGLDIYERHDTREMKRKRKYY